MAINKITTDISLVMEIQTGTDESENPVYRRKSFSGINTEASAENIHAVATAIAKVLENPTGSFSLVEKSSLESAEE